MGERAGRSRSSLKVAVDQGPPAPDDVLTAERKAALHAARAANLAASRPPYADVQIKTADEVRWILAEHGWSGEFDSGGRARADLREANLEGVNLGAARLAYADLRDANLLAADLTATGLSRADLRGAILMGAVMHHTLLERADLRGADLEGANLNEAWLVEADLRGADLRRCHMDAHTELKGARVDGDIRVADVVWNGVPLTVVEWASVARLGDEALVREATTREGRIVALLDAARAYRGLSIAMRSQGLLARASDFRLREQQLERRAAWLERKLFTWFGSLVLDVVSGYGERPARAFRSYAAIVLLFAAVYFALTNFGGTLFVSRSDPLTWYEALVLSLSSFHGRGFFPQMISLGDPVAMVAAIEAVMGLFIELIFIATFSRRFLGN